MTIQEAAPATETRDPLETLACVGRHLERFGWPKYHLSQVDGVPILLTGWGHEGLSFEMAVHCESEPEELLTVVQRVLSIPSQVSPQGRQALRELLEARNRQLRRGAWLYDAQRGEVHFRLSQLLGQSLDYEHLRLLMLTAIDASETMAREGRALLSRYCLRADERDPANASALLSAARLALLVGDRAEAQRLLSLLPAESLPLGADWPGRTKFGGLH